MMKYWRPSNKSYEKIELPDMFKHFTIRNYVKGFDFSTVGIIVLKLEDMNSKIQKNGWHYNI